ncbi:MAG: T9SS type A sorting domain-containing protein [Bacteroidales bacterium]|nr:T9SS type A sorting domain-containing protein [Bacteroidales bacterium]
MKKTLLFAIIALFSTSLFAQVQNVNPDPNGEPWFIGGWRNPTEQELQSIPQLKISNFYKTKDLPASLNNSTLQYFRPIFSQTDGCCAQASGIAYNFTYEINRARNISASSEANQYPTHYTYNFLNEGSGGNGSWYGDGWNIIRANGCPNVTTYGGIAQAATYWMSGYSNYEAGMGNRVVEIFNIDVSTPEGLETMKYWMFNHADGSADGGIVNFSAGISIDDYNLTYNNIVTKWGYSVNHAMTFVGWDDNIEYDYNNDGSITNDVDINDDGVVDMKDWERGAMIMVNSWGTGWGNSGKAYVMYKLLATPVSEGGIGASNMVSSIFARPEYSPVAIMKVSMNHDNRNLVKIRAGVSTNLSSTEPEFILDFPLFNYQGGDYYMRGTSSSAIEFSLDITPLLSYVNSTQEAKFFLQVVENDPNSMGSGTVNSFSVKDADGNEFLSSQTNVSIINNDVTTLSTNATYEFEAPEISTSILEDGETFQWRSQQMTATGGEAPYTWNIKLDLEESEISENYPSVTTNTLIPDSYDDGYATQDLDFSFPFYTETYETVYIRTDGSIVFEPGFDYLRTEDAIKQNKVISVFAADLMIYPENGDGIYYEGNSEYATFRWKTSLFDEPDVNIDVAVTLYPNGDIKCFYGSDITEALSWGAGVSNGDNFNYKILSNSGNFAPSDMQYLLESSDFPVGMSIDKTGLFFGSPVEAGTWEINFVATDYNNIFTTKMLTFNVIDQFEDTAGIEDKFFIHPNPADKFLNVNYLDSNFELLNLQIIDLSGKIVKTFVNSDNSETLDVSDLEQGTYILFVQIGENRFSEKFVIKR